LPRSGVALISCERKGENRDALLREQISKNFATSKAQPARAQNRAITWRTAPSYALAARQTRPSAEQKR
jgi:hypothetical protein